MNPAADIREKVKTVMRNKVETLAVESYIKNGRVPWSPAYFVYRAKFLSQVIGDQDLRLCFKEKKPLPQGYGFGLDERCVEYPWFFSCLEPGPERVLDAGSSLNHDYLLDLPVWAGKNLDIFTLFPEKDCFPDRNISYFYGDLRACQLKDAVYDTAVCLSTLEHIGFDNSDYGESPPPEVIRPDDFLLAIGELKRVLKPAGRLLFTVPFGRYKNILTQQVFDSTLLRKATQALGPGSLSRNFFLYCEGGWRHADESRCQDGDYVDWRVVPEKRRLQEFPLTEDRLAAARSVACVEWIKPQ